MFRSLLAILFSLLVLVQSNQRMVVAGVWYANRNTIIERFCVNKDKPVLKCNGKCQLNKQFKAMESTAGSSDVPIPAVLLDVEELVCLFPLNPCLFSPVASIQSNSFGFQNEHLPAGRMPEVLVPPPNA